MLMLEPSTLAGLHWMDQAACAGMDTDLFFTTVGRAKDPDPTARATCDRCDVKEECLLWALYHDPDARHHGTWGGTSPKGRDRLLRAVARRSCPLCGSDHIRRDETVGYQVCCDCGQAWTLHRGVIKPRGRQRVKTDTAA